MKLFSPNISDLKDIYDKGRFILAWRASVVVCIFFTPLTIAYLLISPVSAIPSASGLIIATFSLIYLHFFRKFKLIYWLYSIAASLITMYSILMFNELTHYADFIWLICLSLFGYIGLGKKAGSILVIVIAVGAGFFYFLFLNEHIVQLQPRSFSLLLSEYIELVASLFVISYLVNQFISFQSNTQKALKIANIDLEQQNSLISSKSKENESLLKEVHHRVKNNFQIIISLLRMQSVDMKNEEGKTHFKEAINRIMAMSLVHQKLYTEKEVSKIDLKSYIHDLVDEISTYSNQGEKVKVTIQTDFTGMSLDSIVPLGLLINELLSNSFKHAFQDKNTSPEIKIEITKGKTGYDLHYLDNGKWKESSEKSYNFGTELIDILTDQLNGTKTLNIKNGSVYHFKLGTPDD